MNYILTNKGLEWMARVNAGHELKLTKAEAGAGYSSNPGILTQVIDKKQVIQIDGVTVEGETATINCTLSNLEVETAYTFKQIGIYAFDYEKSEEILLIIGQDIKGDLIPAIAEMEVEYLYNIGMRVSNAANITFDFNVNDFLRKKYFYEHLSDYDNPHQVTKSQVGLGLVPNVATNDQQPTFERALLRELPMSGETLSIILGKVEKYLSELKALAFLSEIEYSNFSPVLQDKLESYSPFSMMQISSFIRVSERKQNKFYLFETMNRNVVIDIMTAFVIGDVAVENREADYVYGVETLVHTVEDTGAGDEIRIMVMQTAVHIVDTTSRMIDTLYLKETMQKA